MKCFEPIDGCLSTIFQCQFRLLLVLALRWVGGVAGLLLLLLLLERLVIEPVVFDILILLLIPHDSHDGRA